MATCDEPDVWTWTWIVNLCICSTKLSHPSLELTLNQKLATQKTNFLFLHVCGFSCSHHSMDIRYFHEQFQDGSIDEHTILLIFHNFIRGVLNYAPNKDSVHLKFHTTPISGKFRSMFNLAFLTLVFLVCINEAPRCMESRNGSKMLTRHLGSNLEELWLRSLNLAITNRIWEAQASYHSLQSPSPLFSYSLSTICLWKVQLYYPTIAMDVESSSGTRDERLHLSLTYQQIAAVIQFSYRIIYSENWLDVIVVTMDNIRCDVIPLAAETVVSERGAGVDEKHFPSRISLGSLPSPNQT